VGTGATSLLDQAKEGNMRRVTLMLAAMAVMVSLFAAAAYAAAEIWGTSHRDEIFETNQDDKIYGREGDDYIDARRYDGDQDKAYGNRDEDIISVKDGDEQDYVDGGEDYDKCWADPDEVVVNCEKVNGFPTVTVTVP
jgi:hypothetical protein